MLSYSKSPSLTTALAVTALCLGSSSAATEKDLANNMMRGGRRVLQPPPALEDLDIFFTLYEPSNSAESQCTSPIESSHIRSLEIAEDGTTFVETGQLVADQTEYKLSYSFDCTEDDDSGEMAFLMTFTSCVQLETDEWVCPESGTNPVQFSETAPGPGECLAGFAAPNTIRYEGANHNDVERYWKFLLDHSCLGENVRAKDTPSQQRLTNGLVGWLVGVVVAGVLAVGWCLVAALSPSRDDDSSAVTNEKATLAAGEDSNASYGSVVQLQL